MGIPELALKAIESIERRHLFEAASFRSTSYNILFTDAGSLEISAGSLYTAAPLAAFATAETIALASDGPAEYVLLRLRPESVLRLTGRAELLTEPLTAFPGTALPVVADCLREIARMEGDFSDSAGLGRLSALMRILRVVTEACPDSAALPPPRIALSGRRAILYRGVLNYIRRHAMDSPSLKEAAEAFHITPQYLGSFLRETRGASLRELVREAADACGDILSGLTEGEGLISSEAPGILVDGAPRKAPLSAAAALRGESAKAEESISARIDPSDPLPQFFRRLVNLGYAVNLRSLDLGAALDLMQSEIGFSCGRICRITDLITEGSLHGRSYYDFSAVFALLDSLVARGITPFLELGNKSFLIQESTSVSYTPVSPTDTRAYYQQLIRILPEFARACINHYGQAVFDTWYFEISFMYTSDEEREKFSLVQYAAMFRRLYALLRKYSPACRIGGPGFNDWSDPVRIRQMVRLMSTRAVVPDFFSAYIYPMAEDRRGRMHLSGDPDEGIRRIRLFAGAVRAEHPEKDIWITEFNSNLSSRNYLNDTVYQAAYIARMMLGTLPLRIAAIGYYLLSDAPLRYRDSLDFLFGGWGLLTDRGLPKPSFHAYRMMALLGHYRIRLTGSGLITANSRGSFQILLFRYRHPGGRYLYRNVEKEDLALPSAVFGDPDIRSCRIEIGNVLKGTYIVKEYRIDGIRSDLSSVWRDLDFLYPPNAATLSELRAASALIPNSRVYRIEEGQPFIYTVNLRSTEVRLIAVDLYASHT